MIQPTSAACPGAFASARLRLTAKRTESDPTHARDRREKVWCWTESARLIRPRTCSYLDGISSSPELIEAEFLTCAMLYFDSNSLFCPSAPMRTVNFDPSGATET
jgi:hypothetical protein